ncbi:histidine phosphatase family protein [Microbacterium sp. zg.Y1090]|uniref:histidine phosphatase family protein n=1 Tax=Microbacterium TaxID=33882 RepID=UPI00214C92AC|nr:MULTISPECIES: histidine phosphatase family protein [unclassified Microbacterium]MCR2811975.1 histidine phosphatase family protein [Microbacterium sp. zg.Y1084]MCR2818586.1 histidine phosphatase family protein [Microbacterium sp. zg.Y1090]MDL5486400.1 histidine phosphatase family protein [Microbacterium sp. zg-Y1211]WIM29590.1 histidine phosphatase family protein [Microbacterium sp. zg-Y1090]
MTLLTLVRHGETDWNRARRIQGSTDIPLNDTGRAQAREAAERLRDSLDPAAPLVIVSSDLSRARETAEIIAESLGAEPPRLYPQLRERAYGEAEGVDAAEFLERWGDWHSAEVPGAEPWPQLRARALGALQQIARDARRTTAPAAATVIAVAHGALIRELIRHATGGELPPVGFRLPNGSSYDLLLERDRLRLLSEVGPVPTP